MLLGYESQIDDSVSSGLQNLPSPTCVQGVFLLNERRTRRDFLRLTTAAGVGFWVAGGVAIPESQAAIETINFACIGVDGKGNSDSEDCERNGNVVAICDVDENNLAKKASRPGFDKAKKFFDFRKMLEDMGKEIDAVTVSTPDHTHAVAAAMAMKLGKHCFTQKPLTHAISEARKLGELAAENNVATQMGNQGTANSNLRFAAAAIQAGVIGDVQQVHVFTDRPIWPQGVERPTKFDPVPSPLHWEEWLGPAPRRPYVRHAYHQFNWRGWWDFGTGAGRHGVSHGQHAVRSTCPEQPDFRGGPIIGSQPGNVSRLVHDRF